MKLGLGIKSDDFGDDILHYAAQLGVTHVVLRGPSFGERGFHEAPAMAETRSKIESFGLKWEAIENLPGDKICKGHFSSRDEPVIVRCAEQVLGKFREISGAEGSVFTY